MWFYDSEVKGRFLLLDPVFLIKLIQFYIN